MMPRLCVFPKCGLFIVLVLALAAAWPAAATAQTAPEAEIRAALSQWTDDFNAGRADKVCDLFSRDLLADVRGIPLRDFKGQCDILRKALADTARSLSYRHDIRDVTVDGRMAAVRLVWTLTARNKKIGRVATTVDQGLDVFRREDDGRWRIVRYMSYER
jgi:steroid delta-isomerase